MPSREKPITHTAADPILCENVSILNDLFYPLIALVFKIYENCLFNLSYDIEGACILKLNLLEPIKVEIQIVIYDQNRSGVFHTLVLKVRCQNYFCGLLFIVIYSNVHV